MLMEVSSYAIPTVSGSGPPKKNYRWNQELAEMRSTLRRKRRKYQEIRHNQDVPLLLRQEARRDFTEARNRYCDKIRKCKKEKWREFVREVGNDDPWGLIYRFVMEKRYLLLG